MTTSNPQSSPSATKACGCPDFTLSRRRLLGGVAAGTGVLAAGTMFGDAFRQVAYGAAPGGNVVVVLSFRGGSDGVSIVVPRAIDEHAFLSGLRPGIMVPRNALLGTDPTFGLHPALSPLFPMWEAGTFGAVHGVGLPMPNRSHFDAMEEIEGAHPGSTARSGWINRVVGLNADALPEEQIQLGDSMLPTALAGPAAALSAYEVTGFALPTLDWRETQAEAAAALRKTWGGASTTAMSRGMTTALDAVDRLTPVSSIDNLDAIKETYDDGPLRSVLASTAVLIKADLGAKMITIDYGDWDMHVGLGAPETGENNWMYNQLDHFAKAVARFFEDLGPAANRVTLVTISEFGRRIEENGDHGVDHGYGNAMMLFGAGVNGGGVRGNWQPLRAESDLNEGDVPLSQDYRSVLAEVLASRFGLSGGELSTVFPSFTPETVGSMS